MGVTPANEPGDPMILPREFTGDLPANEPRCTDDENGHLKPLRRELAHKDATCWVGLQMRRNTPQTELGGHSRGTEFFTCNVTNNHIRWCECGWHLSDYHVRGCK